MKTPFPVDIGYSATPDIGFGQYPSRRGHAPGVALVIILLFIVLISGVLVAFLSRAVTVRQVANSSANTIGVSLLADGAVDSILGDFKQEIVDGSTGKQLPSGQWLYPPTNLTDAVPTRAGTDDTLPSLVKRSAFGVKFYPKGVARAVNSSSLLSSTNGRRMTPARWNKGLLLARDPANTSNTDFTPAGASAANNTWTYAPDWVLVARDGSNPTTWASTAADASAANNGFVIGRYAYEIYDEGGLLDANAAAYPSGTPSTPELTTAPAYRSNMAFADLRQLPGISNLSATLQNSALDLMLKVRNYTSWDSDGSKFAENYYRFALPFPKGFLSVGNTALKNGRSDLLFSSRQDFLQFMLQALPMLGSFSADDQKALQQQMPNAMPYLTHFSRSLEQPSIIPDTGRPTVVTGNGGNSAFGHDDDINPRFLESRVKSVFTRNDGVTQSVVGDPLVKTRFPLNKIAWLTFKGPIADDHGVLSSDGDLQNMIAELERLGLTEAFLRKGGPTNIQQCFGLTWDNTAKAWRYNHNGSGSGTGNIMRLADVAAQGTREPDFVELLKAAIDVGSLAKGAHSDSLKGNDFPPNFQYGRRDTSTDFAIIQIAANIIDQFDLDGYPTRILFNIGGGFNDEEFRGVENLPYFYRTRLGAVEPKQPKPYLTPFMDSSATPMTDTGVVMVLDMPEIWNPHDQNSPRCGVDGSNNSLLNASGQPLFPTDFRIVANSINPDQYGSEQPLIVQAADYASRRSQDALPATPANSPFNGDFSIKQLAWTPDTTALEFSIPNTPAGQGFFREPTVLMQYNVPAGSNLQPGAGNFLRNTAAASDGGRLARMTTNGLGGDGTILHAPSSTGERYFGMYLATLPAEWYATEDSTKSPPKTIPTNFVTIVGGATPFFDATFRIQSRDPNNGNWVTYDEKYTQVMWDEEITDINGLIGAAGGGMDQKAPSDHFGVLADNRSTAAWDPRTARFSTPGRHYSADTYNAADTADRTPQRSFPITVPDGYGVLNQAGNVLSADRPDLSSGFGALETDTSFWAKGLPNVAGWSPGSGSDFHFGMISQNSTTFSGDGKRWSGDLATADASGAQYYQDADGVVRRAMGGYATTGTLGLPMATATSYNGVNASANAQQSQSRPIILNRPFQSVAELGYVFSGTPWKNLSFFIPESGDAGLLDVFCIAELSPDGLAAGKVDLNTRQAPVLQAILSGAYKDGLSVTSTNLVTAGISGEAAALASKLVARTSGVATNGQTPPASGSQPLRNVSELVGHWTSGAGTGAAYDGFSADIAAGFSAQNDQVIQRRRETPIRALSACGQTRVWNLMIDLVAQTGRYPVNATGADKFQVQGERRCWVHVAIDRCTGTIIDKQIEVVNE